MAKALKKGTRRDFYRYVTRTQDGRQIWTGNTTTNHNTVDCEKYVYGDFELLEDIRSNLVKPKKLIHTTLVHRIMIFIHLGVELERRYKVYSINGDRLDISLSNLGVRDTRTGEEKGCHEFFAANDNGEQRQRGAA